MGTITSTTTEPSHCIGVVLAGGLSTRMGRDKALLHWRGRPLIEHQMDLLRAAGTREVKVSGHRPDYHGVTDPSPLLGPVGGIAGVAATCEDGELLIIPVDMPCLQPALLQRLRDAEPGAGSVRFTGYVLPMRLRLDAFCRSVLESLLNTGAKRARSLRALQERVGVRDIPISVKETTQLLDCNTEETWQEAAT